ncbi:Gp37-like protein [Brevibacterium otitidis]|uniref:Gp28/Gp37-like domain-containing protein n=1 Tax=Brevibacterium otitidis TaxID=53364 RepID=A0ABV5X1B2_9MICO|nr:hypothetical protein GCM10023233_05030 [Brevibacterium otitidis]
MQVEIRNHDLAPRGVLPSLSGKAVLRNNSVSTWSVEANGNDPRWRRAQPGWHVRITDHGAPVVSGFITEFTETASPDNHTRTISISGVSYHALLAGALVIPNPPTVTGQLPAQDMWKGQGPAGDVIRRLIREQIGPTAPADYKVPYLRVPDSTVKGKTVQVGERFTNLLDVVKTAAENGGLVTFFDTHNAEVIFRLRAPRDLTRVVRLTRANGGIGGYTLTQQAPEVTEVIVGGTGTGTTRKLWRATRPDPHWGIRVTQFVDRQSTTDSNELKQAADKELDDGQAKSLVTFDAHPVPNRRFGIDYGLGDRITADLDGQTITDTLQIAEITWDAKKTDTKYQVGPTADETQLNQATGRLNQRVRELSRQLRETATR